jgi:hypothetical protein
MQHNRRNRIMLGRRHHRWTQRVEENEVGFVSLSDTTDLAI